MLYVILDGFDLGIGMLFPFAKDNAERDQMMASIAPFWDGNETWLVMGGVGLLVAFPLAYAIVMPALYLPVIVMLLALVFRGVAFEFREIGANKALWNTAFAGGSTLAGFAQGVILGGMIQGIAVKDGAYAGGTFDWATPFALLCGLGVVGRLCAARRDLAHDEDHGAAGRPRAHASDMAPVRGAGLHGGGEPLDAARISPDRGALVLAAEFLLSLAGAAVDRTDRVRCLAVLRKGGDTVPFIATIGLFLLGFLGLVISSFPYLVPPSLTIWQTAAAPSSQTFMLAGTLVLLPLILGYTGLRLLAVPRQDRDGRKLSLSSARWPARCGRIMPQPTRISGMRPWNCRSNDARHLDRQIGKLPRISGRRAAGAVGCRPDDHRALFRDVLRGHARAIVGAESIYRLGRLGAPSATRDASVGSPATIASGLPVRRAKLSPKNCPISPAGRPIADRPRRSRAGTRSQAPPRAAATRSARSRHNRSDTGARSRSGRRPPRLRRAPTSPPAARCHEILRPAGEQREQPHGDDRHEREEIDKAARRRMQGRSG